MTSKAPSSADKPASAAPHPSGDKRFKLLEVAMKRHQYRQDALIEVLHTARGSMSLLHCDNLQA